MQYLYNKNGGETQLKITGDEHKYLFKVRRAEINEEIKVRNLIDSNLYIYNIVAIDKKDATLKLSKSIETKSVVSDLEIGWCLIDIKSIEKNIHMLNELGVKKISFIYCDRSQKNFKINPERLEKILINSSMQCGRDKLMEIEVINSLTEYVSYYKDIVVADFCNNLLHQQKNIKNILVGPEGGFSSQELGLLEKFRKLGFNTKAILRSETAVICAASLIIA